MLIINPGYVHGSVFAQHQIWVDIAGMAHDIEMLDSEYAQNIIGFCHKRAVNFLTIYFVHVAQAALENYQVPLGSQAVLDIFRETENFHLALDRTPLLGSLRDRLDALGADQPVFG